MWGKEGVVRSPVICLIYRADCCRVVMLSLFFREKKND
jgi:hypothetical protein